MVPGKQDMKTDAVYAVRRSSAILPSAAYVEDSAISEVVDAILSADIFVWLYSDGLESVHPEW